MPASCSLAAARSPATPAPTTTTSGCWAEAAARTAADLRCAECRWWAWAAEKGRRGGRLAEQPGAARCATATALVACIAMVWV